MFWKNKIETKDEDEIKKLILSCDKNIVKYVKQEVTKKLTYLNQMFLHLKLGRELKTEMFNSFFISIKIVTYS